jgi:pimeloyl-ACP methyl ester carboxylesterase
VTVHGTPWSSWSWRRIAPRLAERFAVHVFDLLGFGASERRSGQDVSLAAHGARLAALMEFWRLDRPAVIAHDIGGATALRAHLLHDRRVAALALIDVVALAPWGTPFYRLVRDHHAVFEQLPATIHEGVLRAYVGTAQPRPLDRDVEDSLIAPWLGPAGQSAFYRQIAQGDPRHTDDVEPLLDQITAPTLVIWGGADPWLPAADGAELAKRIPGARLALLPTAGHLIPEERPDELTRLLGGHLDSVFTYARSLARAHHQLGSHEGPVAPNDRPWRTSERLRFRARHACSGRGGCVPDRPRRGSVTPASPMGSGPSER